MPPKATKAAPESTEPSSNDVLASLMSQHKSDHYNEVEAKHTFISSGSLILDQYVKVRSGGVVRLSAKQPEAGKSSQSFVFADNYMKTMPKSKTIYVKAEGRLSPEIQARTGMRFVTNPAEWSYGTVFVLSTNVFETVADIVEKLIKDMHEKGEHLCVIIDSLDGLILKKDLEVKGIDGNVMVAGVPKLTKLLFRRLALPITHYDALLIITGQYSADIKIDPYAPAVPRLGDSSGGSSIPHQCDYILSYAPRYGGDLILEDENAKPDPVKNKIVGVWATIEVKKSATDTTGTKVKIPIKKGRVGCAIWVEKEVVDMAIAYDLVKRSGAWFSFDAALIKEAKEAEVTLKDKVQGINGLYDYIEEDRAVFEWLLARFKKMLGGNE
jgi:hypothetical protein